MTLKGKHIKRIVMAKGNMAQWTESDSYAAMEAAEKGEDLQEPFDDISEPPKGIKYEGMLYLIKSAVSSQSDLFWYLLFCTGNRL